MMARRGFFGALAGGALTLLAGCGSREAMRYKMTVELDTPEGMKSGSAVRQVDIVKPGWFPFPLGESRPQKVLKGEAVAVDVAPGRTLFALVTDGSDLPLDALDWYPGGTVKSGPVELWPTPHRSQLRRRDVALPKLLTFRDLDDPKSVEQVEPGDLAKTFGPGYALTRVTIEKTDDPVTVGIGTRLKWLGKYPEPSLDPKHGPKDFSIAATIRHGDFRQGTER